MRSTHSRGKIPGQLAAEQGFASGTIARNLGCSGVEEWVEWITCSKPRTSSHRWTISGSVPSSTSITARYTHSTPAFPRLAPSAYRTGDQAGPVLLVADLEASEPSSELAPGRFLSARAGIVLVGEERDRDAEGVRRAWGVGHESSSSTVGTEASPRLAAISGSLTHECSLR